MSRSTALWFGSTLLIIVIVCGWFAETASPAPFTYDESDYMYAGSQGLWANYTDRDAMSLMEFVNKGLELSRDSTRRASMSQYVRSTGDIGFYRHYHGPLYAYWISIGKALGVQSESGYRGSGLILHGVAAAALFWLFLWTFPQLPPAAAGITAVLFVMNRTALVTGTIISQHIVFEILSLFTLFTLALHLRTRDPRWWYATGMLLAAAFATVEISIVLIGTALLSLVFGHWGEPWREILRLAAKGTLWFAGTLLVIWPKGVLELNALKGYLYLAYIAVYRKTFSPIGPMELWSSKLHNYPLEFVVPVLALAAVIFSWRRLTDPRAAFPFLLYTCMFVGVTMVVTVPYTHYHGSLLAAASVVTGIAVGELWRRVGAKAGIPVMGAILVSLVLLDTSYHREALQERGRHSFIQETLAYFDRTSVMGRRLYIPYTLIPSVHYYRSELPAVGYDVDWTMERLAEESRSAAPAMVACADSVCQQLMKLWPPGTVRKSEPMGRSDENNELVSALFIDSR